MTKKVFIIYILFCFSIIAVLGASDGKLVFASVINEYGAQDYTFYSSTKNNISKCEVVDVGYGSIISCEIKRAEMVKQNVSNITGESCRIKTTDNSLIFRIIKQMNAEIVSINNLDGIMVVLAYNSNLPKFVIDNEKTVNLQFAFKDNVLTMGYPIILGSY